MYQNQISEQQQEIINANTLSFGLSYLGVSKGIDWLGCIMLPNEITQGRHNVYVDLVFQTETGVMYYRNDKTVFNRKFVASCNNIEYIFEKPLNEVGCSIPIWGENNSVRVMSLNSLKTAFNAYDEPFFTKVLTGLSAHTNVYGHTSYYAIAGNFNQSKPSKPTFRDLEEHIVTALNSLTDCQRSLEQAHEIMERLR